MTPDLEPLARRAVACPRWRWLVGMRALSPLGISLVLTGHSIHDGEPVWREWADPEAIPAQAHLHTLIPDFRDRVTVAALLPMVRDAWGKPDLHARPEGGRWRMWSLEWPSSMLHPTEAEALVAALEAAP